MVGVDGVRGLYVVDVDRCERFVCGGCRQVSEVCMWWV